MDGSTSDERTPKEQTILLNILSPSIEEIPNKLSFSHIPVKTTVRALKERIQSVVPTRPSLPRQRLIYQGKVLASDEANLEDIFGQDAIRAPFSAPGAVPISDFERSRILHAFLDEFYNPSTFSPTTNAVFRASAEHFAY
ncbi:MAG: hypothetical protein LQ352_000928 [Teloschistes flavicans]|nr:MAG: hypothetical protein LQ352_000928 [Teloschistes flavicans]